LPRQPARRGKAVAPPRLARRAQLTFIYFAQNKSRNLGEDQRRQPYMLVMHSITNRNFEINIFALLTFRRKMPGCQNKSRNLGEDQRRQPYMLVMHSITNRNFEINIFALLTFRRKMPGCYSRRGPRR
jgi:hypothetical protein